MARRGIGPWLAGIAIACLGSVAAVAEPPNNGGPYNAAFLQGGIGIERDLPADAALVRAGAPFTLSAWVRPDDAQRGRVVLLRLGGPDAAASRALVLDGGRLAFVLDGRSIATGAPVAPDRWTHVAATYDGHGLALFVDGRRVGGAAVATAAVTAKIALAPVSGGQPHFGGAVVGASAEGAALSGPAIAAMAADQPNFAAVTLWRVGQTWLLQKSANIGQTQPQDPWTLPKSKAGVSAAVAKPPSNGPALTSLGKDRWQVNGWKLIAAPDLSGADGAALSRPGVDVRRWYDATVPGTVLTTLVDRGVYPDPYYGLNNLAIPESLARQDYWYRTSFTVPPEAAGRQLTLTFNGINYAAEVWVNGVRQGETRGAFIRGRFALTPAAGETVVAVRVSPPPHPGIPHEQSVKAGGGENGGQLAIDGPTFVATEGWDWIPGIRDRDTGIWLPVELAAHGAVTIGDPHVVTDLPLPRTDTADVYLTVPLNNADATPRQVVVRAKFGGVAVARTVTAPPGDSEVRFTPADAPQLHLRDPQLWWPNGYGPQTLQTLEITASEGAAVSDAKRLRFGIREVSYDLSLFDGAGALRRVNVQVTDGGLRGDKLIDVTHAGIKESRRGWAESLTPAGEQSSGVNALGAADTLPEPHLTIRVNGVKIAARGGNWGMDDAMKRVDRSRLEPYFRLQKDAHLNIVRNWMGNNDEEQFFDLADEYGMMVLNDFWQSTQNYQVEPEDPQLFLANARDVISRYRNHPSIVVWFGRNEGVPYPTLNEGLDDLVHRLDGTRWYTGSSNTVNLQGSGPYNYRPPAGYFTDLATGFSVESGTPSLSTRESIAASIPAADRWPVGDVYAYHDWHFNGNGDTKSFMETLAAEYGPATGFEDFERKAQMMNLESHKAMYEGFLGHLWEKNSGRLLWMSHPAWPSNVWQIYSWDYDTAAAYYGAKKANEPLHLQLNLPDDRLVLVNTTRAGASGLTAVTRVVSLDNRELFTRRDPVDAPANGIVKLSAVPLSALFGHDPLVLVRLELRDRAGALVSDNFYWRGRDPASYRALSNLAPAPLTLSAAAPVVQGEEREVTVTLANRGAVPALAAKVTLLDANGKRILPAYYSDNYVSLLPDEERRLTIRYPASGASRPVIAVRGWNISDMAAVAGEERQSPSTGDHH